MKNYDDLGILTIDDTVYRTRISEKQTSRKGYKPADPGLVISFIPGTIVDLLVKEGDEVEQGGELLVLDAMKMKNRLLSLRSGRIKTIHVKRGDKVPKGALLMEFE